MLLAPRRADTTLGRLVTYIHVSSFLDQLAARPNQYEGAGRENEKIHSAIFLPCAFCGHIIILVVLLTAYFTDDTYTPRCL